jgi:hypothetical protein
MQLRSAPNGCACLGRDQGCLFDGSLALALALALTLAVSVYQTSLAAAGSDRRLVRSSVGVLVRTKSTAKSPRASPNRVRRPEAISSPSPPGTADTWFLACPLRRRQAVSCYVCTGCIFELVSTSAGILPLGAGWLDGWMVSLLRVVSCVCVCVCVRVGLWVFALVVVYNHALSLCLAWADLESKRHAHEGVECSRVLPPVSRTSPSSLDCGSHRYRLCT